MLKLNIFSLLDSITNSERNDSTHGLVEVKRTVGLFSAVAFIVGSIIGV